MGRGLEKAFQVAFPQAWAPRHNLSQGAELGKSGAAFPRRSSECLNQPNPSLRGSVIKQPRKFNKLKISSTENPGLCISSKEL